MERLIKYHLEELKKIASEHKPLLNEITRWRMAGALSRCFGTMHYVEELAEKLNKQIFN